MDKKTHLMLAKLNGELPIVPVIFCTKRGRQETKKTFKIKDLRYDGHSGKPVFKLRLILACPKNIAGIFSRHDQDEYHVVINNGRSNSQIWENDPQEGW